MFLGSFPAVADTWKECPPDADINVLTTMLHRKHELGSFYVLDMYPATPWPTVVINDPTVADQVTVSSSWPKHPIARDVLGSLTGPQSIFFAEGETFKYIRSIFASGFTASHLMTLVPALVDDVTVFNEILACLSETGEMFQMVKIAASLTMDIIGRVVLDHSFNAQTAPNDFVTAYLHASEWRYKYATLNPLQNPLRRFWHRYYGRQMNNYLRKVINDRYTSGIDVEKEINDTVKPSIDRALDEYRSQNKVLTDTKNSTDGPDDRFVSFMIDQMKSFVVAGHETSACAISFTYYLLSKHPEALAKLRREHDEVLGPIERSTKTIETDPHILNRLPYTNAVIKETLRLHPIASTARLGIGPLSSHPSSPSYPTDNLIVTVNNYAIHRRPDLFPCPDSFIPERFLPAPHNFQDIPHAAYRPFERGQRSCFGQELAMLESRLILAMTARQWDFEPAYAEWDDRKFGKKKDKVIREAFGTYCSMSDH
ncbi:MAG: hypothetical protein Q9227_005738 [Pyrenula ochraceoflavens]